MNHGKISRDTRKNVYTMPQWHFALPAGQDQNHVDISYLLAKLNGYIKYVTRNECAEVKRLNR